jgi:hypothetical protein
LLLKSYIAEIFNDEGVFNIGLEEVEFRDGVWEVTVGFSRKWDRPPSNPFNQITSQPDSRALSRTYKVVEVNDDDRTVLGVRNRTSLL